GQARKHPKSFECRPVVAHGRVVFRAAINEIEDALGQAPSCALSNIFDVVQPIQMTHEGVALRMGLSAWWSTDQLVSTPACSTTSFHMAMSRCTNSRICAASRYSGTSPAS